MREMSYKVTVNGVSANMGSKAEVDKLAERHGNVKTEVVLQDAPSAPIKLTPLRKAMIEQFGYVSSKLLKKLTID